MKLEDKKEEDVEDELYDWRSNDKYGFLEKFNQSWNFDGVAMLNLRIRNMMDDATCEDDEFTFTAEYDFLCKIQGITDALMIIMNEENRNEKMGNIVDKYMKTGHEMKYVEKYFDGESIARKKQYWFSMIQRYI